MLLLLSVSCGTTTDGEHRELEPDNSTPAVHDLEPTPTGAVLRVKVLSVEPVAYGTEEELALEVIEIGWIGDAYPAPGRYAALFDLFGLDSDASSQPPVVGATIYAKNPYYSRHWVDRRRSLFEKNTDPWLNCPNGLLQPGAEYWVALEDLYGMALVVLAEPAS